MNTIKTERLDTRDFITIGIFAAISLVIFFVIGGVAGTTLIGTVANISITVFFTFIAYMLFVSKIKKREAFLIIEAISALSGLTAANVVGVVASVIGWLMTEIVMSANYYKNKRVLIFAYILSYTLHFTGYTLPMYLSSAQYLIDRQEIPRPTDKALVVYLKMFTRLMFSIIVTLVVVTNFLGAVFSTRILEKYFEKAGLL